MGLIKLPRVPCKRSRYSSAEAEVERAATFWRIDLVSLGPLEAGEKKKERKPAK